MVLRYAAKGACILHTGHIQAGSKPAPIRWNKAARGQQSIAALRSQYHAQQFPMLSRKSATGCVANNCPGDANAAMRAAMLTVEPKRSFPLRSTGPWFSPVLVSGI